MTTALQQLRDLALQDDVLRAELTAATSRDEVLRIATARGIELTEADLLAMETATDVEVTDDDLEAAAGGTHPKYGTFTDYTC